jgi:hypothetical protein
MATGGYWVRDRFGVRGRVRVLSRVGFRGKVGDWDWGLVRGRVGKAKQLLLPVNVGGSGREPRHSKHHVGVLAREDVEREHEVGWADGHAERIGLTCDARE